MRPEPGRSAFDLVLDRFRAEPSRLWSVVITVFGDAVVPRGGTVWLGTLLEFFRALEIGEGAVRTAMSRLTADRWLERTRIGRNSFYRLGERGRSTFDAATHHIYHPVRPTWDGTMSLVLTGRDGDPAGAEALAAAEFGSALPGLWIAPAGRGVPAAAADAIHLRAGIAPSDARRLAAMAWPLDHSAEAYRRFVSTFSDLRTSMANGDPLGDADAMVARVLLIHAYRRIVLRDPMLPAAILPADWPGEAARRLCRDLYRALLGSSERWLDTHGLAEKGPLPPAEPHLHSRFGD